MMVSLKILLCLTVFPSFNYGLAPPPLSTVTPQQIELAKQAMHYFDSSPDPFHAVQTSIEMLRKAGFTELAGPYQGKLQPGGRYYFTKNKSTLVAFAIGKQYSPDDAGFKIIGGHTDSPNLRVKPRSKRSAAGCLQLGVECYGGGLWHTWFDRDLGLSGRVLVRKSLEGGAEKIEQRLVKIDRALLRISNLAIHLQTTKEREAFVVNKEYHLSPILAMEVK
jgi:aspartyl aminopeptidase